ncbi:MAG: MFS transporter [Chloroflexota bacterium]
MINQPDNSRWRILALVILTNLLIIAMPSMGMSVMAKEISQDLGLNLVQVGVVWGIGSLPAIITSLLGGVIGDKFGSKRVLIIGSLLAGLLGAGRGLASGFASMTVVVVLCGIVLPFVTMNGVKIAGQWFPARQLGLANGLISMGMALGFLLGSLFSATTFSPLLGGWRNVLFVYGLTGASLSILWLFAPAAPECPQPSGQSLSMRSAVLHVVRLKNILLLGLMLFGVGGAIQGLLGYLPLYLRGLGWNPLHADGALSAFHTSSMIFALPIAFWSDRLGARKRLLLVVVLMVVAGAGLLSFARGGLIWLAVLMAGFVRDGMMAIFLTMVIETEGVGPTYAGTAIGFTLGLSGIGSVLASPIGNSLAILWPGAPFAFWAALAFAGMICLTRVKKEVPGLPAFGF